MHKTYYPKGVCSTKMDFDVENNKIHNLKVANGCNGNLKAISVLLEGQDIQEVKNKLKGIKCGFRNTSCPDQISKALEQYKKET